MSEIAVAGIQLDTRLARLTENRERILDFTSQAADRGAQLVVFPECALSGYVFETLEEARESSEPVPGPFTAALEQLSRRKQVHVVAGMLEAAGSCIFNSAVLTGPAGLVGVYRKTHLPFLGVDRMATPGPGPYQVFKTPVGRLGLLICYDLRFPEPTRCLTLLGADILILPTNWPVGADASPEYTAPARAVENRIFVVAVNRAGVEKGISFIGRSQIVEPSGKRLAIAETTGEEMIFARFDPARAREKRLVITPGVFEIDTVGDRRPELYGKLTE
ncbi:MAG: carbon-nitrogen hydrolase family protein [Acidobacteriota bacterium]